MKRGNPWRRTEDGWYRDLTGKTFGRLTVLRFIRLERRSKNGRQPNYRLAVFECRCSCGAVIEAIGSYLSCGDTASCGCLKRELEAAKSEAAKLRSRQIALLRAARHRARRDGLEYNLTLDDVVIPEKCPLLGIPIAFNGRQAHAGSPSLDRKTPAKGYVKGNIWVISHRANTIKSDATPGELRLVAEGMARLGL
jgi:hypothetical protein